MNQGTSDIGRDVNFTELLNVYYSSGQDYTFLKRDKILGNGSLPTVPTFSSMAVYIIL